MNSNTNDDVLLRLALSIASDSDDRLDPSTVPKEQEEHNTLYDHTAIANSQQHDDVIDKHDDPSSNNKIADLLSQQVPRNASDLTTADSVIASQMAKLSVTDREQVYMDVHGISDHCLVTETPEFVEQKLDDLHRQIDSLPDKRAYKIAERIDSEYLHDPDFLLMFLRCEKFDCPKAALRIIRHFQMKLDLFGMDKLVLDITQDDLDAEGMDVLYSCTGKFLNARDTGGRIINFVLGLPRGVKTDAVLRKSFYNLMTAFRDDEEVQRRGAVVVLMQAATRQAIGLGAGDRAWKWPKLPEGSPMRVSAIHWCYTSQVWSERQAVVKTSLGKSEKVRIRVHRGTIQECLGELRGHGIDPTCIPVNDKGEVTDLLEDRQKLEKRRQYERLHFPLRSTIHVPFSHDVLLGKGSPFQDHPGNKRLRQLVLDRMKHYNKAQRAEKGDIALEIIDNIRQSGGMFLKQDGCKWSQVDDEGARLKVTATFRTFRFRNKKSDD